ncbi:hypothetical protein OHS70_03725 [Streptomyces sp. NBC_00390]|uniref:hypothetical protein n=1 Tax=Streptomyces sp. NBC_00390 TaxID=2975736 RepID=UPI002E22E3AB
MNGLLQADMNQLGRFSRALDRSLTSLAEARHGLEHVRADQLGTKELDDACDAFQKRWKYGAQQLDSRIKSVNDGVKASHKGYTEVNTAIAAAFLAVETGDAHA